MDAIEPLTFDADSGKNGGGIVRTLTGDHNDRVTDMTALILEPIVLESNQNHATIAQTGICSTLPASMGMGGGYTPMIAEVTDTVIPIEGNGARPSHFGNGYRDGGAMYSLNTTEVHAVAYTVDMGGGKSSVCTYQEQSPTFSKSHPKTCAVIAVLGGGREHSTICMDGTAPTLCTFQDSKPILIARTDNAEIL